MYITSKCVTDVFFHSLIFCIHYKCFSFFYFDILFYSLQHVRDFFCMIWFPSRKFYSAISICFGVHLKNFLHRRFEAALEETLNEEQRKLWRTIVLDYCFYTTAITITDFIANFYSHNVWEGGCVVMHRSERCSLRTVKRGVRLMVIEEKDV